MHTAQHTLMKRLKLSLKPISILISGSFDKNDISEMDSSTRSDPPEPPPKDYFEEAV